MSDGSQEISILGPQTTSDEWRDGGTGHVRGLRKVPVEALREQINDFVSAMDKVLRGLEEKARDFVVEKIEVNAGVSVSGEISLLGFGADVGATGSLKFVFTRKKPDQD